MRILTFNELNVVSGGESTCDVPIMTPGKQMGARAGAFMFGAGASAFGLLSVLDLASGSFYVKLTGLACSSILLGVAAVYAINQNIESINEAHAAACQLEA